MSLYTRTFTSVATSRPFHISTAATAAARTSSPTSSLTKATTTTRALSSFSLDGWGGRGGAGSTWQWPVTKANTIFNIVPHGHKFVVERFGKLHSIQESGWFFAVPFVDQIAYVIDVRERAMDIAPQAAITRDNVSVEVSGNLFVKFQDAQAAAYGALNPLYSVTQVRMEKCFFYTGGFYLLLSRFYTQNTCIFGFHAFFVCFFLLGH